MAKKATENKAKTAEENKAVIAPKKTADKVKVRCLPGRGVGGFGGPGTVGFIDRKYAEELVADGYVEIVGIK